jgi:hypothetical protein
MNTYLGCCWITAVGPKPPPSTAPTTSSMGFTRWSPRLSMRKFEAPLDFSNSHQSVMRVMEIRAEAMKQACMAAGNNLAIAQHRDALKYSRRRSGSYKPLALRFDEGDYVYMRRGNSVSTLRMPVHPEIYRVLKVEGNGVASLRGRCGTTMAQHVQDLLPCHLEDIDPRIDPRLGPTQLDVACEKCGESFDPEQLAICANCDRHFHTYCLEPELGRIPPKDWVCPECEAGGGSPEGVQAPPEWPQKRPNLFPSAATRQRDDAVADLSGRWVRLPFIIYGVHTMCEGVIRMRTPNYRPHFYEVCPARLGAPVASPLLGGTWALHHGRHTAQAGLAPAHSDGGQAEASSWDYPRDRLESGACGCACSGRPLSRAHGEVRGGNTHPPCPLSRVVRPGGTRGWGVGGASACPDCIWSSCTLGRDSCHDVWQSLT